MHRTIARLIWYLKRCKTILVIFLKNLGIISQTNSSSLSSRQALAVTKLCCRKPPTQGKVNKIYKQGGVSCLLAVIRQVRSTIKTDGQLMRSRIHGFDEFAESFLLYVMYTCTKFEKHTYIKICYIPGNLLNRHFAYHFMYLNNAETICL